MSKYYKGKRAYHYNIRWQRFNTRTLTEALAMIDVTALRSIQELQGRLPRVLDVACGTGLLLRQLFALVPGIEALSFCEQAGLHVVGEKGFSIDWLWHGWVLSAYKTTPITISSQSD